MRYFLKLCYKGTKFHGWQRQPKHLSIQEVLEESIRRILQRPVICHGCGRTDAGVHAAVYFAHLDLSNHESQHLIYKANKLLGPDITLINLIPVHQDANAQRDAILRTYIYDLHLQKNPFIIEESTWYPIEDIKWQEMYHAAALLPSYQNYAGFCKTPNQHKSTCCKIEEASWQEIDSGRFRFKISADHFLRGMIRLLVGNMIEIGKGNLTVAEMIYCLEQGSPPKFFKMAPARGLHLADVKYPYELGLLSI